ncbi:alpha-crystallin A chain [Galendromus occidentalis]|uniref:Alpha-crystallin A chain n=1 Tax=Galendromus occidentalis TaxID=34638 RepID=A0AAJ6VZR5_9ACAR|nr:alpha-crystallin A chain [Galendromus occidentalis]
MSCTGCSCRQRAGETPLAIWAPPSSEIAPSLSLVSWFDDQLSRMQGDLIQNSFFGIPEVGRIDFDPRRRSRLFDALFSNDAIETEMKFHENPKTNQVECQLSTGCGDFFRPEDIEVNVKDRNVEFKARREQKSEDGHNYTVREVRRVFRVPGNAAVDKLHAEMGPSGKVMLSAPLLEPKPIESKVDGPVPIKINRQ